MAASVAMIGYGARVQINSGNSPAGAYVDLDEIQSITPPSATTDQVDVTHMQSPSRYREFVDGLIDAGEMSFDINYIPGSATDVILRNILAIPVGQSRTRTFRIIYPNSAWDTFTANLQGYQPAVPVDDKMSATVTLKVTGAITRNIT